MKNKTRFIYAALAAIIMAVPAQAMTASQNVEVERSVKQADGSVKIIMTPPDRVLPGDKLVYSVDFYNDEQDVTKNFRLDMPVPAEVIYLEGSAEREGAIVLYSADNGVSYKARTDLTISLAGGGTRTASNEDITHIRWTLIEDMQPGDGGAVQYKGRLK